MVRFVNDHDNRYKALMFVCPGCLADPMGGSGLHMLAVNSPNKNPSWDWNENLEEPTLSPSILSRISDKVVCHSFLKNGVFDFLSDSTHPLSGKQVPIPDLPKWVEDDYSNERT